MKRIYLEDKDIVFATGVFLRLKDKDRNIWEVQGFEDDLYFQGKVVNTDENGEYYIELHK